MKNIEIIKAKKEKNDEFYTYYKDVKNELDNYKEHFKDKVIYLNCDNSDKSMFFKYLYDNFFEFGIKKIITTHFEEPHSYKSDFNGKTLIKTPLNGNGSFDSEECLNILNNECDIVITNPPFSLFRKFFDILINSNKKFLVIGLNISIAYLSIFKHYMDGLFNNGFNSIKSFYNQNNEEKKVAALWFQNLKEIERKPLLLTKKFSENEYEKYDNYDAINCDKLKDIPMDYFGEIWVPLTIIHKLDKKQFKIIGHSLFTKKTKQYDITKITNKNYFRKDMLFIKTKEKPTNYNYFIYENLFYINKFTRVIIKRK